MKKYLVTSCILSLFGVTAHGQSSVTVYGVIDAPLEYVTNLASAPPTINPATGVVTQQPGGDRFSLQSGGGLSGSRWGLRGVEELGGGLQALFVLENGFGVDDGRPQQGGRLFGRQTFVGLQNQWGKLTFGRQYTSLFEVMANFSPTAFATLYEPVVAITGLNLRSDNTVKYTGAFGDFLAEAHWSFGTGVGTIGNAVLAGGGAGEVPGSFRDNTGYGAGISYIRGPVGVAVAYDQWNPAVTAGNSGTSKKVAAAASYSWGPAKIMAGYRWARTTDAASNTLLRDDLYWAGVNYQATANLGLTLAYYYDDAKTLKTVATQPNINQANPWQVSFISDYNLSKRTDLYLTMAYSKNSGLNFDTSAISFANGYFLEQGKTSQFGAAVGIRHKF